MPSRTINTAALVLLLSNTWALPQSSPNFIASDISTSNAEATYAQLQQWYSQSTGLWNDQWWNSGSCLSTIANLASVDGNLKSDVEGVMANSYHQAPQRWPGFVDDYYDDDGWYALAWIAAYDLTGNQQYLTTATSIFTEMRTTFTQTPCSQNSGGTGGIWWNKQHTYINSIANELFLSVAAHLANRVQGQSQEYRDTAQRQWAWFQGTGLINSGNTINDGLDLDTCQNNGSTVVWTYNQGVILGGLIELAQATGDNEYLNTAHTIASAAISQLTTNGILHEACESYPEGCDTDRTQFKGIFVRNLYKLMRAGGDAGGYGDFIRENAESVWRNSNNGQGVLGVNWAGPFEGGNASTTCSGLDVLVAALGQ